MTIAILKAILALEGHSSEVQLLDYIDGTNSERGGDSGTIEVLGLVFSKQCYTVKQRWKLYDFRGYCIPSRESMDWASGEWRLF